MSTKLLASIFISLILVIFGLWLLNGPHEDTPYVEINDNRIKVQVAESLDEQVRGLSGKVSLAPDEGMFFVYDMPGYRNFWMKDMNFAIDIIWISEEQRIVDITQSLSPDTYPESFTSSEPAQYVLEVNAGYADEKGIGIGDYVLIDLN